MVTRSRKMLLQHCRPALDAVGLAHAIGTADMGALGERFELLADVLPTEDEQSMLHPYMQGGTLAAEAKTLHLNEALMLRLLRVPRVGDKYECLRFLQQALDKPDRKRLTGADAGGARGGRQPATMHSASFYSLTRATGADRPSSGTIASLSCTIGPRVLDRDRGSWHKLLQRCISLETASLDLKMSRPLQEILLFVFEVGNFMNRGTAAEQAHAMSLTNLSRLDTIQATADPADPAGHGTDKPRTLMHYIASHALANNRALLKHVKDAVVEMTAVAGIDTEQLRKEVSEFAHHVAKLSAECDRAKKASALGGSYEGLGLATANEEARFARAEMMEACEVLKEKAVQLQEAHARAVEMFASVLAYYGESEGAVVPEVYFECVCSFVQKLNGAYHDNLLKAAEEKRARSKLAGKSMVKVILSKVNGEGLFKLDSRSSSGGNGSRATGVSRKQSAKKSPAAQRKAGSSQEAGAFLDGDLDDDFL
jgi:hypothetical protein